jgi:heme-degrading monooxygenase HmoA
MIASFHLADVGRVAGLRLLLRATPSEPTRGLRYGVLAAASPLSESALPRPDPGRVALIAAWDDDDAIDRFLAGHPLAQALRGGWHTRLAPAHIFGAFPPLDGLVGDTPPAMDDVEPAAVLTIGRLRLSQAPRFLRASAGAERLAVRDPAMLRGTGLARPPGLVATFSLWRTTREMRAYAGGNSGPEHRAAVKAHAKRPFHHASAFIRFRPYAAEGEWDGENPLAQALPAPAPLA